jgi:ankyrin repeat protein
MIMEKNNLYARMEPGYPTIYIAVRSGHYDIVDLLLKKGNWNYDNDPSTPMHCAAYYGHYQLISLLMHAGIPLQIKNKYKHLPVEEAATTDIERLLK